MSIDERLEFLTKSTESLHASVHELYQSVTEDRTQYLKLMNELAGIGQRLTDIVSDHEDRIRGLEGRP